MCFHFFYTVQLNTVYQKVIYNSCLLLLLRHLIQKTKEHILHKWGFIVICSKNNFCIMNKIKLVWFYSLYRNYFFEQKCDLFIYFKKYFLPCHTLENISRILNNSVYFQNIVVCNKPFKKNLISITFSIEKHNLRAKSLILIVPCTRS